MRISSGSTFIAVVTLSTIMPIISQQVSAQTPQQMEYERQQREYRQQMERQQQEQQRQQQLMNENARRQQEESRRLNAPAGEGQTPAYQGAPAQTAPRRPGPQIDATAATAGAEWVPASGYKDFGAAIYAARSTISKSGNFVRMWDMYDFKAARVLEGKQFLSLINQMEHDCKVARSRVLSTTAFSGHMGKGNVVISDSAPTWETVRPGSGTPAEALRKIACAAK